MTRKFYDDKALAISFVIAMAMVALEVSAWVAVFSVALMAWKVGVEKWGWKRLSRRLTGVLSVAVLAQVLLQFRTLIGQDPAYTFLLALAGLRVMDYENERDHKFIILLGFVLISVKSLFSLDIYWIVPSAIAFVGFWYSLLPPEFPQKRKILVKIFLLSLPLATVMFFAFPRLVIPWALSRGGASQGVVGFSDEMNPGQVAELATNTALAFRAKITELPLKESRELYWRGSVLNTSRGLRWRPGRPSQRRVTENFSALPVYEVATESTGQGYLFTLDGTREVSLENGTVVALNRSVFRSFRALDKAAVYRSRWQQNFVDETVPEEDDLQIPNLEGRVRQWVQDTKEKNLNASDRLEEIQRLFSQGGFFYTLSPGSYEANELETFLFERKVGFCEHFAGSYATLARALEIPARVVVGYQGGRYNPRGDFWKISQKDAHAWVEVYLDGRWQRKDPTTWVAPLRLSMGAEEYFDLSEDDQKAFAQSENWRPQKTSSFLYWDELSFLVEDLNYQWTYFLIDFDRSAQLSFFQRLAEFRARTVVIALAGLLLMFFAFRRVFRKKTSFGEEHDLFVEVESWGKKKNLPRPLNESPTEYLLGLAKTFPTLGKVLLEIRNFYDLKMYAGKSSQRSAKELREEWRKAVESDSTPP